MTGQINDLFHYQGKEYSLTGFSAGQPFTPQELGMSPTAADTACWRGYQVNYGLDRDRLLMISLGVNLFVDTRDYETVKGPDIAGVKPVEDTNQHDDFNNNYNNLHYPLDYSGGLMLGNDYNEDFYEHMGFQDSWKYRELLELKFANGLLTDSIDHSGIAVEIQAIATLKQQESRKIFKEIAAAKQSGREDLVEQIREKNKVRIANPAPGKDYDDQIRERVRAAFDRSYYE